MVCSQSCHIYPHTRSHFYTFRFALVTDVESRPPDDDVVCGTSSVCCGDTFRTPSASGLTSCPSFSFSATSGVGGSSSNCIFRSSAASSDFNCFSSSSFFHTFPAISYNCETSFSCTSFFALYWSMMGSGNCVRRLPGQPSPACSLCHTRILILRENLSSM